MEEDKSNIKLNRDPNVLVMPGDCLLKHQNDVIASNGTYLKNGYVYSSLAGYVQITEQKETHAQDDPNQNGDDDDQPQQPRQQPQSVSKIDSTTTEIIQRVVKVIRPGDQKIPFLEPGSIVTCRMIRITSAYAKCSITCIEDHILRQPYTGMIRLNDVHDGNTAQQMKLKQLNKCFHPGDIVMAKVIAAGENHQFLLTTAAPELGVVVAINDWSEPMIPISSTEVFCQRTLTKETRKVANIDLITV